MELTQNKINNKKFKKPKWKPNKRPKTICQKLKNKGNNNKDLEVHLKWARKIKQNCNCKNSTIK